jgi:hypothetical protein
MNTAMRDWLVCVGSISLCVSQVAPSVRLVEQTSQTKLASGRASPRAVADRLQEPSTSQAEQMHPESKCPQACSRMLLHIIYVCLELAPGSLQICLSSEEVRGDGASTFQTQLLQLLAALGYEGWKRRTCVSV